MAIELGITNDLMSSLFIVACNTARSIISSHLWTLIVSREHQHYSIRLSYDPCATVASAMLDSGEQGSLASSKRDTDAPYAFEDISGLDHNNALISLYQFQDHTSPFRSIIQAKASLWNAVICRDIQTSI